MRAGRSDRRRELLLEEVDQRFDRIVAHEGQLARVRATEERQHDRDVEVGGHLPHLVALHSVGRVQDRRTQFQRATRDFRSPRVDAEVHTQRGERGHDRLESLPLGAPRHDLGVVGAALATEIETVGAVGQQRTSPVGGGLRRCRNRVGVQRVGAGVDHSVDEHCRRGYR